MKSFLPRVALAALTIQSALAAAFAQEATLDWLSSDLPPLQENGVTLCVRDYLTEAQGASLLEAAEEEFKSKEAWEAYSLVIRRQIREGAGFERWPKRTPLNAHVSAFRRHGGYEVANVSFESIPGYFVSGNLYRPSGSNEMHPGVLSLHGHSRGIESEEDWEFHGRFTEQAQTRAAALAGMGAVVLSIDSFGYGDSIVALGPSSHKSPLAMRMHLWNGIRALDFLQETQGVDPSRLAVTGASGGGTQTILLAALDERVSASVPVVMVSAHFFGGCPCESGLPIHRSEEHFASNAMIAALFAPKPQLLVSDGKDWTSNTERIEYPFLQHVYNLYDAGANVSNVHLENEGHDYGPSKRAAAYEFLSTRLSLEEGIGSPEDRVVIEAPEKMRVFNSESDLPSHALRDAGAIEATLDSLLSGEGPSVFLIGDSTMAIKKENRHPETGWGEGLAQILNTSATIHNHAVNGRSSKSFRDEGRWDVVLDALQQGDYVVIQFGHNDEKERDPTRYTEAWGSYQENLRRYALEARERGAEPIFATPICRRKFNSDGNLVATHGEYPDAVRALAKEMDVPLVDMQKRSADLLRRLGDERSKELFLHLQPGEHANYSEGVTDDTHLSVLGSREHAGLFLEGLRAIGHPLAEDASAMPSRF